MSSLVRRLAITIAVPAALYLVGEHVLLPGVPAQLAALGGGSHANLGVLALGIAPVLSAYGLIEVIAFLVPRWRRLRHGDPEGRAKLDRAARILALALAGFQGFGVAQQLLALESLPSAVSRGELAISVPVVTFSLVGGVCLQFVAARVVTQRGLGNGFAVLLGASLLIGVLEQLAQFAGLRGPPSGSVLSMLGDSGEPSPRQLALAVLALAVATLATWVLLGRPSAAPWPEPGGEGGGAPYRAAGWLVVHPWIPMPASSLQATVMATSLLMLPQTLKGFHVDAFGIADLLQNDAVYLASEIGLIAVVMVVFARLMHRPAEMQDLVARVSAKARGEVDRETRGALNGALVPTFLFFLVIAVMSKGARVGLVLFPMVVALLIDLGRAIRIEVRSPEMVPVWEERRASAVPVLRAALAADGVPTEVRGMAVLSLWQVFAPYAPAEIVVRREDAERATKTLRHWSLGEPAPERTDVAPATNGQPGGAPWSPARRNVVLGACVAAAVLAFASARMPVRDSSVEAGPPARLEVVRVDDTIDPFAALPDAAAEAEGIQLVTELVPVGRSRKEKVTFARLSLRAGEPVASGRARFRAWLAPIPLPADARFGLQDDTDLDPDTNASKVTGLRSFVLRGESALHAGDVTDALRAVNTTREPPEVYVAVTLSTDASLRFEEFTHAWTQRRIAVIVDDEVMTAPVVMSAIGGGHISVTMGTGGDHEARVHEATRLAARLRPR